MILTVRPFGAAMRTLLLLLGLVVLTQAANAACNTPTGAAGDMTYSTSANVMAYCDGTNWVSMAGGVSLTVNTSGGGATPYGSTGDVQINNVGALGGDTGNFTYAASTLAAPIISASTINSAALNNTGLGTFGSILDNGGLTVLGAASLTTVSATGISGTLIQVGSGAGATCATGLNGAMRYNSVSGTMEICVGTSWTGLASGTLTGSGISGGSATAIAFWNGPNSLTYESATTSGLYWDHTNGRLGIGTNTPNESIDVSTTQGRAFFGTTVAGGRAGLLIHGYSPGGPYARLESYNYGTSSGIPLLINAVGNGVVGIGAASPTATLQVSGTFTVSQTGQNSLASASLAVDARGVSISSIVHITGSPISPIGAGGNAILSGTTTVSTSSAGSIGMFVGGNQRMIIGTTYFGFGTTAPSTTIDVNGIFNINPLAGYYTDLSNNVAYYSGAWRSKNGGPGSVISLRGGNQAGYTGDIVFFTTPEATTTAAGAALTMPERMRIDSSGNILVGTSNAGVVNPGVVVAPTGYLTVGHANGTASGIGFLYFGYNNLNIGSITQNGTTAVLYNTTSDRRVKEDITDTREGLQKLMQIGVKDFSFKADPNHTIVNGFIAQDLNRVYPEAVTTNGDNGETPLRDKSKVWAVDYGRVTPLIVKAVQDLKHLFDTDHAEHEADHKTIQELSKELVVLQAEVRQLKQRQK